MTIAKRDFDARAIITINSIDKEKVFSEEEVLKIANIVEQKINGLAGFVITDTTTAYVRLHLK